MAEQNTEAMSENSFYPCSSDRWYVYSNERNLFGHTEITGLKDPIKKQMSLDPRAAATINAVFAEKTQKHIPYHYLSNEYVNRFDKVRFQL